MGGNVWKSRRDSAGIQGPASGRARVAAGDTDGKCAAGSGERRDFQGRDGAGDLWAADVRDVGADDGAAQGGAGETGNPFWWAGGPGGHPKTGFHSPRRAGRGEFGCTRPGGATM